MSEITFLLSIHHGGRFNNGKRPRYIGGKVTQVCENLDIDKLSYPEILSYVKEDLGYDLQDIAGIYYFKVLQGEFILVEDDNKILQIASRLCSGSRLEFYIDHKTTNHVVDDPGVENTVDQAVPMVENVVRIANPEAETVVDEAINRIETAGEETLDDKIGSVGNDFYNYEDWFEDFDFEEEENDVEDDPQQQTFDNLNVNVGFLTDDDEEELQQFRDNVRALRKKNEFGRKTNDNVCEGNNQNLGQIVEVTEAAHDSGEEDGGSETDNDSTGSFYYDSDDNCSYYSETDEECGDNARRRQSKTVRFDTSARIPNFCCGMLFKNSEECRDALAKYAIVKGLQVHFIKNDRKRIRAGYMPNCPWKFYATIDGSNGDFTLKTYVPNHKCHRKNTNPMATSKYLAKHLRERLMSTPSIKLKDLKNLCRIELKLKISITQARNIKKRVLAHLMGNFTEEYKRLHDYVHEINTSNPGTTCVVKASKEEGGEINHFRRFYVCFAACKRGWMEGCRKIIGLDGCFLKGVCKGQLLCAIGRDGNNQMFPIAWAVVSVENKKNWGWFLKMLRHDLCLEDGGGLTIISDMQKGLDSAIREYLPQVEHRMCARHVYAAWAKKWRGEERKLAFWNCARSTFRNDLKSNIQKLNLLGDGIVQDLEGYNIESFSKAHFRTSIKCDVVDNNMAEAFNGWIVEARCKPIISMLEDIRTQVMMRLHVKRRFCRSWICQIAPRPMMKLEKNNEQSYHWELVWNGDDGYEVSHVYEPDNRHTVHLDSSTCTCREWDLTGIPCQHAISALNSEGKDPKDYVCYWYTEKTYLKAYQFMMQPVKGKILWTESGKEEIAPPPHKKLPGRPKLRRRKDKDEITKKSTKLSKKGLVMKCTICKQPTHNRRKCPNKSNVNVNDAVSQTGKRKNREKADAGNNKIGKSKMIHTQEHSKIQVSTGDVASSVGRSQMTQETVSPTVTRSVLAKEKAPKSSLTRNRVTKEKKGKFKGYGCYVNETTGLTILNPGTSTRLNWMGKAAMTTRQLQEEAQRKAGIISKQAKRGEGNMAP